MLKLSFDKDYKAAIYLRLSKEDGDFSISGENLRVTAFQTRECSLRNTSRSTRRLP